MNCKASLYVATWYKKSSIYHVFALFDAERISAELANTCHSCGTRFLLLK